MTSAIVDPGAVHARTKGCLRSRSQTCGRAVALEIRRVGVRDGFRVLDVKIKRILSASSFVHGALLYSAPTLNGIPRHRECTRILNADIRLQHVAIIDHAKALDNMQF